MPKFEPQRGRTEQIGDLSYDGQARIGHVQHAFLDVNGAMLDESTLAVQGGERAGGESETVAADLEPGRTS